MNEFLKFYQNKPLEIKFNKNDNIILNVVVIDFEVGTDMESGGDVNVITVHIKNIEEVKHYTYDMVMFHLKKELKGHLSLFSIDGDLVVSLR
jgi:hypothetical protein